MNCIYKIATIIVLVAMSACTRTEIVPLIRTPTGIELTSPPEKTDYIIDEKLSLKGLVVTVHYDSDESVAYQYKDFKDKGIRCSPNEGELLTEEDTVIVITQKAIQDELTVAIKVSTLAVIAMEIISTATIIDYYEGQVLSLEGLVIKLTTDAGTTEEVRPSQFASKGIKMEPMGNVALTSDNDKVVLTHTSSKLTVQYNISVQKAEINGIELASMQSKSVFYIGEKIDLTGLKVNLTTTSGAKVLIGFDQFEGKDITTSPAHMDKIEGDGPFTVTIFIEEFSVSYELNVITSITDVDNNVYPIVKIGEQIWMAENLKVTKFRDGTPIPEVTSNAQWAEAGAKYSWYNNDKDYADGRKYGALYTFVTISQNEVCPEGWYPANYDDWWALRNYLINNGYNWDGSSGGDNNAIARSMASKYFWEPSGTSGAPGNDMTLNNKSGFTGMPAGYRDESGNFHQSGTNAVWWVNTLTAKGKGHAKYLGKDWTWMDDQWDGRNVNQGLSVRCIKAK